MVKRASMLIAASVASLAVVLPSSPAFAANPRIMFTKVVVDPSGKDTTANSQLVREVATLKNTTSKAITLTNWTVRDKSNHVYKFGTFTLGAGKSVRLHTGKGANTSTDRYWGLGWYVWNNTGDAAYVRDASGRAVDSCSWATSTSSTADRARGRRSELRRPLAADQKR